MGSVKFDPEMALFENFGCFYYPNKKELVIDICGKSTGVQKSSRCMVRQKSLVSCNPVNALKACCRNTPTHAIIRSLKLRLIDFVFCSIFMCFQHQRHKLLIADV